MKKFVNQEDIKYENCIDIFDLIKANKLLTRRQIEAMTGLSWGAVSNITSRLIQYQLVSEEKAEGVAKQGRTPSVLAVDGSRYCTIGLDVNIMGLQAELINLKEESLKTWRSDCDYSCKDTLLSHIFQLLQTVLADEVCSQYELIGLGVAMQGIVDAERGISVRLTQCPDWEEVPLAELLEAEFRIPVWIEHDPNCILLAYTKQHALQDAILLRIGRGIGMAVMLDGKIIGKKGMFEIGHTNVVPGGELCSCGRRGCLEAYASVTGVENLSGQAFDLLMQAAEQGEKEALKIFENVGEKLGTAIFNMQRLFRSTDLILCGKMMQASAFFMERVNQQNEDTSFSTADVGAASYGAAMIAMNQAVRMMKI